MARQPLRGGLCYNRPVRAETPEARARDYFLKGRGGEKIHTATQVGNGGGITHKLLHNSKGEYTIQKVLEQLQTERGIMTEAWYILKAHLGIEKKDYEAPAVAGEWDDLVESCRKLYYTSGTEAQQKLARAVAMALMDYYEELQKTAREERKT